MRSRRWLFVLGFVSLVALGPMAGARQDPTGEPVVGPDAPTPPPRRPGPRVVIDGATHPEAIPDDLMITMLIGLWALPPDADADRERRLRQQTRRLGLAETDFQVLRQELRRAYPELMAARQALDDARVSTAVMAAQAAVTASSAAVYDNLLEFLSAEGRQKLAAHIAYAKSRTTLRARP